MRSPDEQQEAEDEILLVDLRIGDQFTFDGFVLTVIEPPQSNWGMVEVWVAEQDWPFEGGELSTVRIISPRSTRTS